MVVLKYGQYYLTAHDDKSTHWSKNPKSALVLSAEEMKNLHITGRMVSASVLTNAHNFIVAYTPPEGGPVPLSEQARWLTRLPLFSGAEICQAVLYQGCRAKSH